MTDPGDDDPGDEDPVRAWYARYADAEAHGSPLYEGWARGIVGDPAVRDLIRQLPAAKRQPALVFACTRMLGAPERPYPAWRAWLVEHWSAVAREALRRRTQTNDAGRLAPLLPVLGRIAGPIALLEIGASAGLCLYPDRYAYRYDGGTAVGESTVVLACATTGDPPIPATRPEIVWRAGLDVHPLDVRDPDAMRWLELSVPPEHSERRERIRAAVDIARTDPPRLLAGDLDERLDEAIALAPRDATLVILHTAVMPYIARPERERVFARLHDLVRARGARWIAAEPPPALTWLFPDAAPTTTRFAIAFDGALLGFSAANGSALDWGATA